MTYQEKFDYLKKTYALKADLTKLHESFAAQIEMTDDDCHGIFYVAFINGNFSCEPYDYRDNTVAISINSELLEEILTSKADPVEAFLTGKFSLTGSTDHALMMIEAMKKEPKKRKTAAKKTTEKKVTEKKTAEKKTTAKKKTVKKEA